MRLIGCLCRAMEAHTVRETVSAAALLTWLLVCR
jgi:hypothetical protein